jgi:hypothetical protein
MRVPSKDVGKFAEEIYQQCMVSRSQRAERGQIYKNIYLTGDEQGIDPAIYNNTFAFIDNLSSYLYSPVELRFTLDQYGTITNLERAKMKAASSELHKFIRRADIDTQFESGVTWALVKGKTFIKLRWTANGLEGDLVQPELMGVLQENFSTLDKQEAFCHTTFLTPDRLWQILATNSNRDELFLKAQKYCMSAKEQQMTESDNNLRQIIIGGIQPYTAAGSGSSTARGQVNWLESPSPQFAPEIMADLIPLHELWVWDDERGEFGEWTTIQFIGPDVVIAGELTHRNLFAEQYDPDNKKKKTNPSKENPLTGKHPFIEICPNPLEGYFWGRSEIANVALLQKSINERIDGINRMLRRQEDPPKYFTGTTGPKQSAYSIMKKAGGYLTDSNPNAKASDLYPQLPDGIWESLHEFEQMFEKMGGFTATLSGRGEKGVRSHAQSEALIRTASPRFKDRALLVERQLEELGGLALDLLKAHIPEPLTAWVSKKDAGLEGSVPNFIKSLFTPIENTIPVEFLFYDLDDNCKVVVDSHSSSPAFSHETQQLLFDLLKVQAIDQEQLVQHLHPPGMDAMLENLWRAKVQKEQMIAEHPELLQEKGKKKK